jgi:hypothetical protein
MIHKGIEKFLEIYDGTGNYHKIGSKRIPVND